MKNILLVTLHSQNNNFGSVLQGRALYSYIQDLGYNVRVLDYRPAYSNGGTDLKSRAKRYLTNSVFLPFFLIRNRRFRQFIEKEKLTGKFSSYEELEGAEFQFDIYLVGSDQVWNPEYNCGRDPAYYLEFTDSRQKMSYAASLGKKFSNIADLKDLAEKLNDFKAISVRENDSADQLKEIGAANVQYVLDPVFLYTADYYRSIQAPKKESGYILAYIIHKDSLIAKVVDELSKRTKKRVVQVGGFAKKCKYDSYPRSAGPLEFLSLVDGADFIITSSFHGTAFSLIYEKQFAVVMPASGVLRLKNILETAGLSTRVISKLSDSGRMLDEIDYTIPRERISAMRETSQTYLSNTLSDLKGI